MFERRWCNINDDSALLVKNCCTIWFSCRLRKMIEHQVVDIPKNGQKLKKMNYQSMSKNM